VFFLFSCPDFFQTTGRNSSTATGFTEEHTQRHRTHKIIHSMEHRVRDTTRKLTREEVNAITPREVHAVLGRTMLVDGFDFVRISALFFSSRYA